MRRRLRSLAASVLTFALMGGVSAGFPTMPGAMGGPHDCNRATESCNLPAFTRCCCPHSAPVSLPPTSDRTSELKAQNCGAAFAVVPAITVAAPIAGARYTPSTHRAGPPIELTVLHASLLL